MANPFLTNDGRDVETAILLDKANVVDIGKAVAYADSKGRIFLNTDENLRKLLPAYDDILMKKWLLWHEHMHLTFKHHQRFFKYRETMLEDIATTAERFNVTMQEVNIIMDILVHDWMCEKFPELIETAVANLAQIRNRNSLGYTFKTYTLEEMLDEYRQRETDSDDSTGKGGDPTEGDDGEPTSEPTEDDSKSTSSKRKKDTPTEDDSKSSSPAHSGGEDPAEDKKSPTKGKTPAKDKDESPSPSSKDGDGEQPADEHDKTDWSKLKDIDSKEFIDEREGDHYIEKAERLKRKKIRLGTITQKLNSLATTTKIRTYRTPSLINTGDGCIFKGKIPGKTALYLVFDASGSMSSEMSMFKDIIRKSVPQALDCPCEWFSGWKHDEDDVSRDYKRYCHRHSNGRTYWDYYKGRFRDILNVSASGGYNDDGDRTIELCLEAEQKGYSPIGVTDGGWEDDDGYFIRNKELRDKIKTLKRTIIVTQSSDFIKELKKLNPTLQTIYVGD